MIEELQSSIIRPKAVAPMFQSPAGNLNSQTLNSMNQTPTTSIRSQQQQQLFIELGNVLRHHDPQAARIHDCISQVQIFTYNSTDLRWENHAYIEGNLCGYERKSSMNNLESPFVFAVIQGDKILTQIIEKDMVQHGDKLRLFYEVTRHDRREVFAAHFQHESDCERLQRFIVLSLKALEVRHQQIAAVASAPVVQTPVQNVDPRSWISNGQSPAPVPVEQTTPNNIQRQTTPVIRNQTQNLNPSTTRDYSRPMVVNDPVGTRSTSSNVLTNPNRVQPLMVVSPSDMTSVQFNSMQISTPIEPVKPVERSIFGNSPVSMNNGNGEDPTSSLKRLLNIRSQNGLENLPIEDGSAMVKASPATSNIDLMPPSAFEPITAAPPSPLVAIGAERVKHRPPNAMITREQFRNVILHLIQTDDRFLDIIYQACLNYPNLNQ